MTQERYEFEDRRLDDTHIWIGVRISRIVFEPEVNGVTDNEFGTTTWSRPARAIVMTETGGAYYFEGEEAEALEKHPVRKGRSE